MNEKHTIKAKYLFESAPVYEQNTAKPFFA